MGGNLHSGYLTRICPLPHPRPPCPLCSPSDQSNWIKMTPIIDTSCSRAQTQRSISECVCNWCLCSQRSIVAPCSTVYLGSARLSFQPDLPQRVLVPLHHERNGEVTIFTDIWEIIAPSFHQLFTLHKKHVFSFKWTVLVTGCNGLLKINKELRVNFGTLRAQKFSDGNR